MNNLIGITGVTGSGKDTVASILLYLLARKKWPDTLKTYDQWTYYDPKDCNLDWEVKRFAAPLKNFVAEVLGVTREQLEDREFKESQLGEEWVYYQDQKTNEVISKAWFEKVFPTYKAGYEKGWKQKVHTPRSIMELIGTEVSRAIHPNFHINALFSKYKPVDIIPGYNYRDNGMGEPIDEDDFEYKYPNWIIPDCRFDNEARVIKSKGGIVIRVNRNIVTNRHSSNAGVSDEYVDYELDNNGTIEDLINQVEKLNFI